MQYSTSNIYSTNNDKGDIMKSNKLWSALTHYNTSIIKYRKKYDRPNLIQRVHQDICGVMLGCIISMTDRNDANIHHDVIVELHRDLQCEGMHCWYEYRVIVKSAHYTNDDAKKGWRKLEEIIIGGDE